MRENDEIGPMDKAAFAATRSLLGKSQRELAELLGLSLKAVESYEQGWRSVPSNVERMLYYLLFKLNQKAFETEVPCWAATSCSEERRGHCVAYVAQEGHFCWFFTGGLCASAKAFGTSGGETRHCYGCAVFIRLKTLVEASAEGGPLQVGMYAEAQTHQEAPR
jgi:hypothetical protein